MRLQTISILLALSIIIPQVLHAQVAASNPLEWMLASAGLVHLGCTTGVEAAVLDIPRIGLVPKVPTTRIPRVRLSNLVSAIIRTPEEAARASRDLIEERGAFFAFPWQKSRGVLDAYLAGLEGEYAFQKIARSITTDLPDHDSNTRDVPSPISGRVDEELRKVVTKTTFEDAHVERSHLERKMSEFGEVIDPSFPWELVEIKDLNWGVYHLSTPAS